MAVIVLIMVVELQVPKTDEIEIIQVICTESIHHPIALTVC